MPTPTTMPPGTPNVPRRSTDDALDKSRTIDYARLSDVLCDEAALEMLEAFDGISGKKIDAAAFPGVSRHGISRACNGDPSNPLYRLAVVFLLMKRLGIPKRAAKKLIQWLDDLVERVYGPDEDQKDVDDDPRAALEAIPGIVSALRRLVAIGAVR